MAAQHFPTSVIALFCEDIREEKSGQITLLGIFPDNLHIANANDAPPGTSPGMPKLCIYVRINFDPETKMEEARAQLLLPDGTKLALPIMEKEALQTAIKQAKLAGAPVVGVYSRVEMAPFLVKKFGRATVEVELAGQTYLAGHLNFTDQAPMA